MKITLVIFSLSSGGAERVMSIIANYWSERGEIVSIITIDSVDRDFYSLHERINRVGLNIAGESTTLWSAVKNNFSRLKMLRSAIQETKPDIVISFLDRMSVLTLVATRGLSLPIVVSEHIDPRQLPPGGVWNSLRRWTYRWASAVVVLTSELRNVLSEFVDEKRLYVIPNPALPTKHSKEAAIPFDLPKPFIVAMGRLVVQKGFDLLLEAFCHFNNTNWSLVILGEGPERKHLESITEELGIRSRVYIPGRISDPSCVLRRGEFFVLSSRFEGFPMAILEAMSCGLPVISFDCPTGPREIISDGVDGVLVPPGDVTALAEAMNRLMEDGGERKRLANRANKVTDKFSLENVMARWLRLINVVIGEL